MHGTIGQDGASPLEWDPTRMGYEPDDATVIRNQEAHQRLLADKVVAMELKLYRQERRVIRQRERIDQLMAYIKSKGLPPCMPRDHTTPSPGSQTPLGAMPRILPRKGERR